MFNSFGYERKHRGASKRFNTHGRQRLNNGAHEIYDFVKRTRVNLEDLCEKCKKSDDSLTERFLYQTHTMRRKRLIQAKAF
jgi:hypothetical protein